MEVRLLGPVEVLVHGQLVDLGPARQRTVLAALAVDAGRPVPAESLIDRVWGEQVPQRVRQAVYAYITRIRKALGAAGGDDAPPVVRRSGGYLLDIAPALVDLHRFNRLVEQARERDCSAPRRLALLRQAMQLWRGDAVADLSGDWADRIRQACEQQRLDALADWADAEIRTGDVGRVVAVLTELLDRYPLRETLVAALMRALDAVGRSADALDWYLRTRRRLVDELGIEPGGELQALHHAILRGDQIGRPTGPAAGTPTAPYDLAQLPPDVRGFTGRQRELERLDALVTAAGDRPATMVISAVSGTAGVGKTALAVHWAHRVAHWFPDGQLYVNLHGFGPTAAVVEPAEALRGFLDALGVPAQRIPVRLADRAALYRSRLTNRRVLVVVDNARDAEQVRPLLPGSPACVVIVTSRDTLTGLVAAEGAAPLVLDRLCTEEAGELLAGRLGRDRLASEPDAVDAIISRCAGLPLALAIVAAHAATRDDLALAAFADQLGAGAGPLDALDAGDRSTDVRAVFSWSYRSLEPLAARLFRLLGLHTGRDIGVAAAASLAGLPVDRVAPVLGSLARGNLVMPRGEDRYAVHDLLRAYAAELVDRVESETGRLAALDRLCSHYLRTGCCAAARINPQRDPIEVPGLVPGVTCVEIAEADAAMRWFTAESSAVTELVGRVARTAGPDRYAWRLAWTLWDFFNRRGLWHDWLAVQSAAVESAAGRSDRTGEAYGHRGLVLAYSRLGRYQAARTHAEHALELYRRSGDAVGQAHVHFSLSWLDEQEERHGDALAQARRALELFAAAHHLVGEANARNAIGWRHARLAEYEAALEHCGHALARLELLGDRYGQAATWDSLGFAHHHLGQYEQAMHSYHRSLALFRLIGDRYNEADVLNHLGDTYRKIGRDAEAERARCRAAQILTEIDELGAAHPA